MNAPKMPNVNVIAYLSLIVAMSAYISSIRLRIIDKKKESTSSGEKKSLSRYAACLIRPDLALILSGYLVFLHGFWHLAIDPWWPGSTAPDEFLQWSVWLFAFAGICLTILHVSTWRRSFNQIKG